MSTAIFQRAPKRHKSPAVLATMNAAEAHVWRGNAESESERAEKLLYIAARPVYHALAFFS
jgi:hypothetical protein